MLAAIADFHHAHHIGIGKRTDDEGYERGCCNAGCQTEDGMKTGIVGPIRRCRNGIADSTQRHEEEVHRKAGPDQQTRFLIAPYFTYHIIDDVAYREYDESTGKGNWPEGDLLCFEYVCCNQANAEEDAEKHKQHAHLSFFLVHFLVFYEVYQALGLLNMMILFRNRLQNYNFSS